MLDHYLTMNATLKVKEASNDYGEPIYREKEIKCRIVDKFKEISNDKGDKVVSNGVIQCKEFIKVGDMVETRKIIAVNSMTSLNGVIGYRGYLI